MLRPDFSLSNKIGLSKHFTWGEALGLKSWNMYAIPFDDYVIRNIEALAPRMDMIRDVIGFPLIVTSWYRPEAYNQHIGGAKKSSHVSGMACDFITNRISAQECRAKLVPHLTLLNIRMEKLDDANWVHVDINCDKFTPLEKRYFKP